MRVPLRYTSWLLPAFMLLTAAGLFAFALWRRNPFTPWLLAAAGAALLAALIDQFVRSPRTPPRIDWDTAPHTVQVVGVAELVGGESWVFDPRDMSRHVAVLSLPRGTYKVTAHVRTAPTGRVRVTRVTLSLNGKIPRRTSAKQQEVSIPTASGVLLLVDAPAWDRDRDEASVIATAERLIRGGRAGDAPVALLHLGPGPARGVGIAATDGEGCHTALLTTDAEGNAECVIAFE